MLLRMHVLRRIRGRSVSAQRVVLANLLGIQYFRLREMRPQMDLPYSSLQPTNGFERSLQLFLRDGLARKHVVELSLLLDQLVSQYDGFRLHRLEQRFGAHFLVRRKRELSGER